jgi:hypothetical protein
MELGIGVADPYSLYTDPDPQNVAFSKKILNFFNFLITFPYFYCSKGIVLLPRNKNQKCEKENF